MNEEIGMAFRKDVKMFPELAIRELVANALIHQDFTERGAGPMIEIFDDRVEVINPGKPIMSTMRFVDHNPQSRNEKLAHFMRRLNICEEGLKLNHFGSSIPIISSSANSYFDAIGLPGFQFIQDRLRFQHSNMDRYILSYDHLGADDLKQSATIVSTIKYYAAMRDQKLPRKKLPE